jgi:hypothetical protein
VNSWCTETIDVYCWRTVADEAVIDQSNEYVFSGRPSVGSGCSRKASFLGMGRNTGCAGYPWFFIDARRSYITLRSVRSHYSVPASPCTRIKKEVPFIHVPQESS